MTPRSDGASIREMRGEQLELELLAEEIRGRAGLVDTEVVSSLTIARRVMGVPIQLLPTLPNEAALVWNEGRYRIVVRSLEPETHFAVAHELAHWAQRELAHWQTPFEENFANRIAAAICAPRALVHSVRHRDPARRFRPLAKVAHISETSASLRLQSVYDEDRAVVTARHRNVMGRCTGIDSERARRLADGQEVDEGVDVVPLRGGIDRGRKQLFKR